MYLMNMYLMVMHIFNEYVLNIYPYRMIGPTFYIPHPHHTPR
jgi:hypothetical protein